MINLSPFSFNNKFLSKRLVVIGGGVAGVKIAKLLESTCQVILIDPKDYHLVP